METRDVVLPTAEHDNGFIKVFPFLSKRRRTALKRVHEALAKDPSVFLMDWTAGIRSKAQDRALDTISSYSSVTLEAIHKHYAQRDNRGISSYFMRSEPLLPEDEMLVRAFLSYYNVLERVLPEDRTSLVLWDRRCFTGILTAAKAAHPSYMREDVATLEGPERAAFEALILVYAVNVNGTFEARHSMSHAMEELVMEHPDRVDDILDYQEDRGLQLMDLNADVVADYLNAPSAPLSSGLL